MVQGNFDGYRVLRMNESPEIMIELIDSGAEPGGVGELAVPTVAPAVANAMYRSTGVRPRSLPLALS